LQAYSGGRFILGLGSQIKPHIERRFSMPWSHPAPRMREFVMALRAIWSAWNEGTKLSFRGDFYQHTLMTPFFSPPPAPGGAPRVFLAAVGEAMTAVAREVAGVRQQIAFYGSTPAYRGVLDRHGWGGLGDELNALSKSSREGKWEA